MDINVIILIINVDYFINGYCWLSRCKPLVFILLVVIYGYFINGYCIINNYWILYVIIS